ncbi:MAG: hypothetical protein IKE38_04770, partial [Erysipelotrichaceae bacterium]|nr:hypothetical protein [Erysipelotrichaceae bacterium]
MKKGIRKTIAALLSATIVMAGILPVMSRKAEADEEKYAIIVSTEASDPERFAAEALFEYLSDLPVNDLHFIEDDPLIADDQIFEGYRFCVGTTSVYPTSDIADAPADSYVIAPFTDELGDGVAIYGSGSRGTVYGVFTFLEDFCGYRHYTYLSGMVSTTGNMELPSERIEYEPYFEYRNTDWRSGWYPLYSVANKLNGDLHGAVTHEQGGNISYLGASCHTLSTVFCSS